MSKRDYEEDFRRESYIESEKIENDEKHYDDIFSPTSDLIFVFKNIDRKNNTSIFNNLCVDDILNFLKVEYEK